MEPSSSVASRTRSRARLSHETLHGTWSGSSDNRTRKDLRETPRDEIFVVSEDDSDPSAYDTDTSADEGDIELLGVRVKHYGDSLEQVGFKYLGESSVCVHERGGVSTRHDDDDDEDEDIEIKTISEAEFHKTRACKNMEFARMSEDGLGKTHDVPKVESLQEEGFLGGCSRKGIASRSRLKRGVATEPLIVHNTSSDSSHEPSSSDGRADTLDGSSSDCAADYLSFSTDSEDDDSDDEDFTMDQSDCSDSMELSSSFVEEDDLHGDEGRRRSGLKSKRVEVSDSGDDEEEGVHHHSSKRQEGSVRTSRVNGLQDNGKRKLTSVAKHCNIQEGLENGAESETEDTPISKTRETEDLIIPSQQSGASKKKEEEGIDESKRNKKRKVDVMDESFPASRGEMLRSKSHKNIELLSCKREENEDSNGSKKLEMNEHHTSRKEILRSKPHKNTRTLSCEMEENEDGDGSKNCGVQDHYTPRNENLRNKKTEGPTRRGRVSPRKDYDLCKNLLDSVLDEGRKFGDDDGAKQSSEQKNGLPLRFRFEDEVVRPVEKSEFQIMNENLFAEMELCLMYGDMDFSAYKKEVEEDHANSCDDETTQYTRCCKGKHYLIEDDENGLVCLYCLHVELEAKDIMPQWVPKTYQGADRTCPGAGQPPVLNELNTEPGEKDPTSCSILNDGTVWDIKPGIKQTMYEHQREGLEFLWKNLAGSINLAELETTSEHSNNIGGGCIISHAPGTGKTRLTMVFVEMYLKLFPRSCPLIIAPASMLLTWEEEFKKWGVEFPFHNLNNVEVTDKENKVLNQMKSLDKETVRHVKIYTWNKEQSVLGMSYRLFEILAGKKSKNETLKKILLEKPGLVVLDEGHTARSKKSNIWNALSKLKTQKRIILSGTPFQNNFQELFNILRIVRPAIAGVFAKEKMLAEMMTTRRYHKVSQHAEENNNRAIEELKTVMAPFVHVHKGTILQQSLPGLRDCVVLLKPPPLQQSLIERIEGLNNTFKFDYQVALISVHPYLFKDCPTTEKEHEGVDQATLETTRLDPTEGVKTRFLMELVRLSVMRNEKVLVFSQYIKPLMLIQAHLKTVFGWTKGKHILKMEGSMGQKNRQDLINAFNNPKSEAKVLLASTKCCSEGINLVGASRVVLLDVVWNPSVERQAISRAYRLGQKRIVYTYHLMTKGTTEGDKYCRQAEKERLSELVFTSSSNEKCKNKSCDVGIEDGVLEDMVDDVKMKDVFEKIIYQPKEQNLIETFNIAS